MRAIVLIAVVLCAAFETFGEAQAPPAKSEIQVEPASKEPPAAAVDVDIEGEEIGDAVKMLSEATGFSILVSGKATGKITAYVHGMDPESALEQTVKVNGLRYVREGKVVWILTEEEYYQDFNLGREHRIIPLQHAKAAEVATALQPDLGKNGRAVPYPDTNVLVLVETKERIADLEATVARLDRSAETRIFQLKCAVAADAVVLLQPHMSTASSLQADMRTNQLIITDTPERLAKFDTIIQALDQPDKILTRAFSLKYANADRVADLLREMLTGHKQSAEGYGDGAYANAGGQDAQKNRRPIFTTEPAQGRSATPRSQWQTRHEPTAPPPTSAPAPSTPAAPAAMPQPAAEPLGEPVIAGDSGAAPGQEAALGPLQTVVADTRTNTVIVTHTASTLDRIAEVIRNIDVPSDLHFYQFQNGDPAQLDLETKLAAMMPTDNPYFNVEPISRKVTWRSGPDKAQEILKLLQEWDQAIPQVRIEAEILSVSSNLVRKLGISWQAVLDEMDGAILDRNVDARITFPTGIGDTSPQGRLTIGTLATDDYSATLQALESDADTEVLARPRILVKDGQDALFSSARDEPYTVVTVSGETNTTMQDVKFLNVGVTLGVMPNINKQGIVSLEVQLEISSLAAIRNGVPVVDRSTAQSTVNVRDGGTMILGGLRQRSRSLNSEGVPGLMKVPVLGGLFRNRTRDRGESEIVLILRPRVVGADQTCVPDVTDVTQNTQSALKEKALKPDAIPEQSNP
jgi:type II secretory pathway component GspD/PulD (secretin)